MTNSKLYPSTLNHLLMQSKRRRFTHYITHYITYLTTHHVTYLITHHITYLENPSKRKPLGCQLYPTVLITWMLFPAQLQSVGVDCHTRRFAHFHWCMMTWIHQQTGRTRNNLKYLFRSDLTWRLKGTSCVTPSLGTRMVRKSLNYSDYSNCHLQNKTSHPNSSLRYFAMTWIFLLHPLFQLLLSQSDSRSRLTLLITFLMTSLISESF